MSLQKRLQPRRPEADDTGKWRSMVYFVVCLVRGQSSDLFHGFSTIMRGEWAERLPVLAPLAPQTDDHRRFHQASDSTLTSGFLATFLETAAVYVLFIAWRSITEDDWEDDPAWQRSDR